jgi:diketogulonate reductase-like aldo/keto reductase
MSSKGVTLLDTWRAMENLVDRGKCRAIGLSDITLNALVPICESARIKPAVVQVESHPYLPEAADISSTRRGLATSSKPVRHAATSCCAQELNQSCS